MQVFSLQGLRFVVARMGLVTRSLALDDAGRLIRLPKCFDWNTPWYPRPRWLPCGLLLLDADGIEAAGMRENERLVWLRVHGLRAEQVASFEGVTTLDEFGAQVSGNRLTLKSIDEPAALMIFPSDFVFERRTTWICGPRGPRLIRSEPRQTSLRAVDRAIVRAWHARTPTRLQKQICKLCAPDMGRQMMLEKWTENRGPAGSVLIVINGEVEFTLRATGGGPRVIKVRAIPRTAANGVTVSIRSRGGPWLCLQSQHSGRLPRLRPRMSARSPADLAPRRHSRNFSTRLAGAAGLEPATCGFGDRRSTN